VALAAGAVPSASAVTLDAFTADLDTSKEPDLQSDGDSASVAIPEHDSNLTTINSDPAVGLLDRQATVETTGFSVYPDTLDANDSENQLRFSSTSNVNSEARFELAYTDGSSGTFDLAQGGNNQLQFEFDSLDSEAVKDPRDFNPGPVQNPVKFEVEATDGDGDSGSTTFSVSETGTSVTKSVAFSSVGSSVDFSNLNSVTFSNAGSSVSNGNGAKFSVDSVEATPFGFSPSVGLGTLGLLYGGVQLRRCWKRKRTK